MAANPLPPPFSVAPRPSGADLPPVPRILALRVLAVAGLVLAVIASLGVGLVHQALTRQDAAGMSLVAARGIAQAVGEVLHAPPTAGDPSAMPVWPDTTGGPETLDPVTGRALESLLARLRRAVPLLQISVIRGDGMPLYVSGHAPPGGKAVAAGRAELRAALEGREAAFLLEDGRFQVDGQHHAAAVALVSLHPLTPASLVGHPGGGVVEVVLDLSGAVASGAMASWGMGGGLGLVLAGFSLLLGLAAHRLDLRLRAQQARVAAEIAERLEAEIHLRRIQDAMENTIAERTRQLRESEGRFRSFAESASDWLWETDEDGRFTFVSDGFRRLLGIEPASLYGLRLVDLRAEASAAAGNESWQRHFDDVAARRPFRAFSFTIALPGGGARTVSLSGQPIFDERGRFRGYRGTGTDLTHQHEAEQTITRLGRILDQSAIELLIFQADTQAIVQANRGARRNLGYTMEDLRRLTPLELMPGERPEAFSARLRFLRQRPTEVAVFQTLHRRRDGSQYPVEVRLQYAAQERPPVFVAVAQDITARKRTEQALQESEERYRSIAEMSLDSIVVHVDGMIVYANRQALAMSRADTADAMVGQPFDSFFAPEYHTFLRERLEAMHATGQPTERAEVVLRRCDDTLFEAELSSSPITYGGRAATQTVLRDITETKAVQTQLIQAAKLATLGEMAAGMAHELSQPMNVIRMAAEGALLERPDSAPAAARMPGRAALEIIVSQAARMGEIIDHMRIFSRKQAEPLTVFDPALCVRQALNMVESQFYAEDVSVSARYPAGQHGVRGRTVHLEQVLLNLLTNARDSIRARIKREADAFHGQISIDTTLSEDAQTLSISVTDNGGGIPEAILDRIFEPFYTTKEVGTGTGLGLSVSFGLITAMNGTISVRNVDGGACFRIDLPVVQPGSGQEDTETRGNLGLLLPPLTGRPAGGGGAVACDDDDDEPSALIGHVLVVDDEPFATKLVSDHLESLGYRVTSAFDGEEAYQKFLDDPPDLLITDLRMPRCDGAELVRRVHGHVPDLPVVVVTGHLGHLEAATAELKAHSAAILKKPISLAELGRLVESLVSFPNRAGLS